MPDKKTKGITLDDLAHMMAKGFDSVDQRFDSIDQRFESVDERFDSVDQRFESLEQRMATKEGLEAVRQELKRDIGRVDSRVEEVYDIVSNLEQGEILDLQKRVKVLERTAKAAHR